ncbi:hypothetical protein GQ600_27210 [Phytophthora cactorum]|nr:hypothetical protein GQ600_27210 [Phytophthora cactorum]
MPERRGGGSQMTVATRNRKEGPDRQAAAYARAIALLGEETLLQQGLSERVIKAIIPVGGTRIGRLRKMLKLGIETFHTRRERLKPWHAFSDEDLGAFKAHCLTWILEDGLPCAHRRPRQYFTEPKLTWKIVHGRYVEEITRVNPDASTVRLTRTAEDVCDCCVRLDVLLQQPDLTEEQKQAVLLEKAIHLCMHLITSPGENYPDTFEDTDATAAEVQMTPTRSKPCTNSSRNFGGGISMPHYGHTRPSADYFNSNLIVQNFVVADITNGRNNVYFYDERGQIGCLPLRMECLLCHKLQRSRKLHRLIPSTRELLSTERARLFAERIVNYPIIILHTVGINTLMLNLGTAPTPTASVPHANQIISLDEITVWCSF